MALDAAQFDPTLLPLEAQALAPDVEGNVTARGILGERADDRSFKIESGKVTIIERGHERPAKGNEIRDVVAALNVSIRDEQVRVTSEKLGSQELRVRLRFSNGVQEKTLEEYMIEAQLNRTRDAVRATTAEQEQNENRLRQKTKERTEALKGLQEKRAAILALGQDIEPFFRALRAARGVATVVGKFSQALRTDQNDVPKLTQDVEMLNAYLDLTNKVLAYEDEVQAAARANGVEAGDPEWSQLSLSKKDNLQELHDELDALGKQFDQRVEILADTSAFAKHWKENFDRMEQAVGIDLDPFLDLKKFGASLYSLEESLKNVVLPGYKEQNIEEIHNLLTHQRALLAFKEKLETNAKQSGIDLNDSALAIFDAIRNPARAQLVAALEALEKAARIDLGYELGVKKAFDKVFGRATDDEQAAIEHIWYSKTNATNAYEEGLFSDSTRLNVPLDDSMPTNTLQGGQEMLEENTSDLTHLKEVYDASSQALNGQDVPQGSLNEGKRKQEKAAIVAAFAKHSADLNAAIEANQATLKKIEAILARRGDVKERAMKHRAPKKGRIGKAVDVVAGMNPLKGLVAAKNAARQERSVRESTQEVNKLTGTRTLDYNGGQIVLRFNDDGTVQQQQETGNNNPDGTPIMEWSDPRDQTEVCKILNAQKDKEEDVSYQLNNADPAAPYIEEVRGTGEVDNSRLARAGDWLSGARRHGLQRMATNNLKNLSIAAEKQKRRERQAVIDETKLMPILEELRKEGKPEYEARDLTRSLLRDEKDMDQEEADAVFAQAWKALEDKANSWWTKGLAWVGGVPGRIKGDWDKGEEGNLGKFWKGTKENVGGVFKWAGEHLPSGDTVLKAGGAVLGGLSVGAGLLGLGGIYLTTNIVRGALAYGGQVAHQVVEKGGKLAGTAKNTAVNVVKAPFRLVASPLTGAWNGLVNGWNYPDPAKHRKPKGWTAPLTWMRNKLSSAWRMTKAAPTAIAAASLGLALGAAYRGPVDSLAPVIGINAKAPVPAFMLHQEKHSPNVIEVAEKAAPAKAAPAAAPAADHGAHGAH